MSTQQLRDIVYHLTQLDRWDQQWIIDELTVHLNPTEARPYPHVGTLTPAQLADLDPHDKQAREAAEQ